ncbi:hypothetical protein FEM48_Zijuj11G0110400 [Ziziphus jujuba var. spinosa]|uniref:Uncharacterized protein n=1 Tax=Ziziphus jujuba var. spinosa TaxID=714518 RepID=A0A978UIK6_ZIZJJ|nr:hypothetical protein FEM48_Zijuj11G0110400 [Ziziphus jujuba var. spinosa]
MEENRKQQLAISSSKPPASDEVAPSFAGNDNYNGDETKAITSPDQFMEGPQSGESTHENPTILRLEELTSMDPTAEVGFEIADSVGVLKLTNSSNPEMERAAEKASRGARLLQEGAKLVTESQQILGSATFHGQSDACCDLETEEYDLVEECYTLSLEIGQGGGIEELQGGYSEALVNHGVYASVKSQLASGKGTKIQTSSSAQAASQTQGTNKNGAA